LRKKSPQLFHRPTHAHLRRILAGAERLADLLQALVLEKAEDNRMAIRFIQARDGSIEQGARFVATDLPVVGS